LSRIVEQAVRGQFRTVALKALADFCATALVLQENRRS